MSARTARWIAVSLWALSVALAAAALVIVALDGTGWDSAVMPVVLLAFPTVGALIASRYPGNAVGWLFCWEGLSGLVGLAAAHYATFALFRQPGPLPAADVMAWVAIWTPPLAFLPLLTFGFLLFPDGHLPSPGWRPVAWVAGVGTAVLSVSLALAPGPLSPNFPSVRNPFGVEVVSRAALAIIGNAAFILVLGSILVSAGSMLVRLRRSRGDERQQLKWFVYAAVLLAVAVTGGGLLSLLADVDLGEPFNAVVLSTLPVAAGIAVFRYRLYEIDLVISKTVVIGALAGFITTVYVAVVVGLGAALGTRGEPSVALSILATAIVAVAFQPVRERVQRLANRLVYGRRATPYEVLAAFASRMGGTYASEDLLPRMARTLAEGTGAARAEVWLAGGAELHRAASWPEEAGTPHPLRVAGGELPAFPDASRAVPVRHHVELLGALTVAKPPGEPLAPAEDKLLSDLAAQAGLVLRNVRLIEELRASRQRLVTAQDAERRRLERDIHDGAQQHLVTLSLAVRMARDQVSYGADPALAQGLEEAAEDLRLGLSELRDLARGIHPAILTEEGLGAALESVAERSPVPVRVAVAPEGRFPAPVEATAYFVVSEALANVAKHARASSVAISAQQENGRLVVEVADDGVGGADAARGSGLQGLADRVAALDGRILVDSPKGQGTTVRAEIPCESS